MPTGNNVEVVAAGQFQSCRNFDRVPEKVMVCNRNLPVDPRPFLKKKRKWVQLSTEQFRRPCMVHKGGKPCNITTFLA